MFCPQTTCHCRETISLKMLLFCNRSCVSQGIHSILFILLRISQPTYLFPCIMVQCLLPFKIVNISLQIVNNFYQPFAVFNVHYLLNVSSLIPQWYTSCLETNLSAAILYMDINFFTPFNCCLLSVNTSLLILVIDCTGNRKRMFEKAKRPKNP